VAQVPSRVQETPRRLFSVVEANAVALAAPVWSFDTAVRACGRLELERTGEPERLWVEEFVLVGDLELDDRKALPVDPSAGGLSGKISAF